MGHEHSHLSFDRNTLRPRPQRHPRPAAFLATSRASARAARLLLCFGLLLCTSFALRSSAHAQSAGPSRAAPAPAREAAPRPEPCTTQCKAELGPVYKSLNSLERGLDRKVSSSELERRLGSKLDLASAELALGRKADKAELASKADQRYVDAKIDAVARAVGAVSFNVDRFWVLLAAVLVFFMQAGFKCLEVGLVQMRFDALQGAYKLFSWIMTCALYALPGFSLMFSVTRDGIIGGAWASPTLVIADANLAIVGALGLPESVTVRGLEYFLFQAAFAATAVTIPAGAIAERARLGAYVAIAGFVAAWIYPVFGHWAWGGGIYTQEVLAEHPELLGWLQRIGFHDYAGSTVVHSIGGWCGLVLTLFLGARPGRFGPGGTVNVNEFPPTSRGYAILGVFMLWFGWWGFNGGSGLKYDDTIAGIIFNTNLAGAAAGISAYLVACVTEHLGGSFFKKGFVPEKVIGGILGGLVAITASCDRATPVEAFFVIGLSAGLVHNLVFDLLLYFEIDDPVGAVPVHAGCGVLGTLLTAFTFPDVWRQLGVQAIGAFVAFAWAFSMSAIIALALRALRQLPPPSVRSQSPVAVPSPDAAWTV